MARLQSMSARLRVVALVLLTLVPALGCAEESVLRMHGSNTIGERLALQLAEAWMHARGLDAIERSSQAFEEVDLIASLGEQRVRVEVKAHGSSTAFTGLLDGAADIGMSSRPISEGERERAAGLGDLTAPESEIVLALDHHAGIW